MDNKLIIKSSRSAAKLTLSTPGQIGIGHPAEYLSVTLTDREIVASCSRIYLYEPYDLAAFFDELASDWKGWPGKKEWSSVEDDLVLSCSSDDLGHVAFRVKLKSGPYEDDWCVTIVIHIDAGQLEELAVKLRSFLRAERTGEQAHAADSP